MLSSATYGSWGTVPQRARGSAQSGPCQWGEWSFARTQQVQAKSRPGHVCRRMHGEMQHDKTLPPTGEQHKASPTRYPPARLSPHRHGEQESRAREGEGGEGWQGGEGVREGKRGGGEKERGGERRREREREKERGRGGVEGGQENQLLKQQAQHLLFELRFERQKQEASSTGRPPPCHTSEATHARRMNTNCSPGMGVRIWQEYQHTWGPEDHPARLG